MDDRLRTMRQRAEQMGLAGVIVWTAPHIAYLADTVVSPEYWHFLIMMGTSTLLVLPNFEAERLAPRVPIKPYTADAEEDAPLSALREALQELRLNGGHIGVELRSLPAEVARFLSHETRFDLSDVTPILTEMRAVKDGREIGRIRQTISLCDDGFEAARNTIAPGVTELDVALSVWQAMSRAAGRPVPAIGDFISALRTVDVGGEPSQRRLQPGDLFIVDVFPVYQGYYADQSRSFVVGSPAEWHLKVYDVIRRAFEAAVSFVRPGITCHDLDSAIREVISEAGYGHAMRHGVSHSIGLSLHEPPITIRGSKKVLEEGMVITCEPGIYLPGRGGLRLEDDLLVTAGGCEVLGRFTHALTACG